MSRLIDADALIAQMEADAEQMEEPIAKMFTYAAINDVKHAPTIEPERKTGKWIPISGRHGWMCSECKEEDVYAFYLKDGNYVLQDRFCPNCGSYNGGEQNEIS